MSDSAGGTDDAETTIKADPVSSQNDHSSLKHELDSEIGSEKDHEQNIEKNGSHNETQNSEITDSDSSSVASADSPPVFLYSRLNSLPRNFLDREPVSCSLFHESLFVFATHSGLVHVCKPDFTAVRTYKAHSASVLALDTDGTHVISASMDGSVVVTSTVDSNETFGFDFKRPVHAVAIDRKYSATKAFYSGGMSGKVIHSSRNWLGKRSDTILYLGDSPIVAFKKVGEIIVWMNDTGISFFDTYHRNIIKTIDRPDGAPRGDLYWPRIHFPETDRILIAWAYHVWSIKVQSGSASANNGVMGGAASSSAQSRIMSSAISFRSVPEKHINVEHVHQFDFLVAGISSFKDDKLLLLSYEPPVSVDDRLEFQDPDLKIVDLVNGQVDFEEEIGLRYIKNLGLNDYSLGTHIGNAGATHYIMSAKDAVIAKEVQLNDRLEWYIAREDYLEAWKLSQHLLSPIKRLNLGTSYVDTLIKNNEWNEAANFLLTILHVDESQMPAIDTKSTLRTDQSAALKGDDELIKEIIRQWEIWATIFLKSGHVEELTKIIPTLPQLNLPPTLYDEILEYWLKDKSQTEFYDLIGKWDLSLFTFEAITLTMESSLEAEDNEKLRRCLAALYVRAAQPQKAVPHLAHLRDRNLVKFLRDHHLIASFVDNLPNYISLSLKDHDIENTPISDLEEELQDTIEILVESRHELPPHVLTELMAKHHLEFINLFYLERLEVVDDYLTVPFQNDRLQLFAQYDRKKLLPFLTKHSSYDIQKAIQLCEDNDFVEESVYLWGKVGETKKALMLIINKLDDPEKAINFAKHQNDKEAWDILLEYAMEKPAFIKALIEHADEQSYMFYDPILILEKMPRDVKIEGLKESVTKISYNNDLNVILNQLILRIIYNKSEDVSKQLRTLKLKGIQVDVDEYTELFQRFETILVESMEPKGQLRTAEEEGRVYTDLAHKIRHLEALRTKGTT